MRLIVILLMAAWLTGPAAKAQDSLQAGFSLAFNQSGAITQNMFEDGDLSNLGGIEIGFATLFEVKEGFSFNPALAFSQKGYKLDYGDAEMRSRFSYLKLPVKGRFQFPLEKFTMFANVGPYFGFLLSARESGREPNPSRLENASEYISAEADVTRNYKYGDVGVTGGAGIMYPFREGHITFQINYEEGFVNIARENNDSQSIQNKGYQVALGYLTTIR